MPAGRPSAEPRPCLCPRAGYDATDDKGHYHLNVYCEDVDDEAYHADPAVDQWWGDSEACDCSCYSGEADSNNYYNNYEYDSAAYMCVDDFQNFDPRCDWSCAHAGPYCYDGGSDNHGCSEWSNDEAGPCCVSGAPTVTPAPSPMPMPDYEPVYEQGCNNYIHMDGGYYGTSEYMWGGSFSLEQCAAAVWWYDGIDGCMGDYFYYEYGWGDGYGSCACENVRASLSRVRPHLRPRPPPCASAARNQATARPTAARSLTRTRTPAALASCSNSSTHRARRRSRPRPRSTAHTPNCPRASASS